MFLKRPCIYRAHLVWTLSVPLAPLSCHRPRSHWVIGISATDRPAGSHVLRRFHLVLRNRGAYSEAASAEGADRLARNGSSRGRVGIGSVLCNRFARRCHRPCEGRECDAVAQTRSLRAAGAFTTHPIRFLLLGDSVALTLGTGLNHQSVSRYGVEVIDKGDLGCDLDSVEVNLSGSVGPATPGCLHWRSVWAKYIAQDHPDVVGVLIGRWEVSDHFYDGTWVHIGEASWDEHIASELNQLFGILSSKGARILYSRCPT